MTAAIAESVRIPASPQPVQSEPRARGLGLLELLGPQGRISLPLAKVSIEAKVAGAIADCTLSQTFQNTSTEPLEAEYIFPLPGGAAVRRFELKVAGRVVVGQVRERGQARRDYQAALQQGKRAALLEQERGDVFTVSVGNLPPGESAEVRISWSERLPVFEDGSAELRLPLVVAPRYIAGTITGGAPAGGGVAEDTSLVPDASRLTPPRLAPGFDPNVNLSLVVELLRDPSQPLEDLSCSQHAMRQRGGPESVKIDLAREGELLDRDFVLRWRMAGAAVQPELLVYRPPEGPAFGVLTLVPPRREGFLGLPRDVVFVLDRSGSMEGQKMIWASRACALLLRTLGPRDRYAIQAFDDRAEWFEVSGKRWHGADEKGLEAGEKHLREVDARGGTELDLAMREALALTAARGESAGLPVIVLLTDGQIGDESSVLKRLQRELGESRVFTVGIDTAVNAAFLTRLAALGGGTASFVEPGTRLEEALRAVGREIGAPLITDLMVTSASGPLPLGALAPAHLPDLFAGRPAAAFVSLPQPGALTVTGKEQGGATFTATVQPRVVPLPALAQLWAKARVSELEDQYRLSAAGAGGRSPQDLQKEIVDLAVLHTLLTRFTAFLAIDEEVVNPGGQGKKVTQPVHTPQGWELEAEPKHDAGKRAGAPRFAQATMAAMPSQSPGRPMGGAPSTGSFQPSPRPHAAPAPASPTKAVSGLLSGLGAALGGISKAFSSQKEEAADELDASASFDAAFDDGAPAASAPPPPPPAQAKRTRMALKKGKRQSPPSAFPEPEEAVEGPAGSSVGEADRAALRAALEPLTRALEAIQTALAAGQVPDPAALEKARRDLLALLATSPAAAQAGQLQRLLRSGLTELSAALKVPGTPQATLLGLCQQRQRDLAEARAALDAAGGTAKGSERPFWGASV